MRLSFTHTSWSLAARTLLGLSTALWAACASVEAIVQDTDPRRPTGGSDTSSSSNDPDTSDTGTKPDTDTGFPTGDETVDTGETSATATQAPTDSGPAPTDVTTDEPDTEFVCSNTLQCTLKWFGTICCDKRCINPTSNVHHCGACHNDCMDDRRGNACFLSTCNCGVLPNVRCLGEDEGECCTNMLITWACGPC